MRFTVYLGTCAALAAAARAADMKTVTEVPVDSYLDSRAEARAEAEAAGGC